MGIIGIVLLVIAGGLFFTALISLYSTTMTVRRSRVSPWVFVLGGAALLTATAGVLLLLLS